MGWDYGKVPGLKLSDNSLWLITERESELLADLIVLRADPALLEHLEPEHTRTLEALLVHFQHFCVAAARHGGFWAY